MQDMAISMFDSHCHLDDRSYEKDFDAVLERARQAGVAAMMTVGVDGESSARCVQVAEANSAVYASVGVHPHEAKNCSESVLQALSRLAGGPKVKAWGEIGLDFNRMHSPRIDQEHWFSRQLEAAAALKLPVILHERDSNGRLSDMLTDACLADGGVIHCFSGNPEELTQYLDLGLFIGITGILTIKSRGADLRRMVKAVPNRHLLIETDAPYLTPAPERNRFRRNEPAFVRSVLMRLAAIRQTDPEILAKILWRNTCRLYNIDNS